MRLHDSLAGLCVAIVGLAVVAAAHRFPAMPGQAIGPSLFPTVIGAGLILLGGTLAVSELRRRDVTWLVLDDWTRRPGMARNFGLVIADLLFYAVAVTPLGFFLTSAIFLGVLFAAFGLRWSRAVPIALAVTLVMHYGFYTWLRVPLPWGVLERMAW
jgi:putative tricarboxylic transport membrane protein